MLLNIRLCKSFKGLLLNLFAFSEYLPIFFLLLEQAKYHSQRAGQREWLFFANERCCFALANNSALHKGAKWPFLFRRDLASPCSSRGSFSINECNEKIIFLANLITFSPIIANFPKRSEYAHSKLYKNGFLLPNQSSFFQNTPCSFGLEYLSNYS